jgi:hypothetical protein
LAKKSSIEKLTEKIRYHESQLTRYRGVLEVMRELEGEEIHSKAVRTMHGAMELLTGERPKRSAEEIRKHSAKKFVEDHIAPHDSPSEEIRRLIELAAQQGREYKAPAVSAAYYVIRKQRPKLLIKGKGGIKRKARPPIQPSLLSTHPEAIRTREQKAKAAAGERPVDHIRKYFAAQNGHVVTQDSILSLLQTKGHDFRNTSPSRTVAVILGSMARNGELKKTKDGFVKAAGLRVE